MSGDASERIALGAAAESILENEAWQSAVRAVDGVITQQWRDARTPEVAWEARQRLRALNDLLGYLHAVLADGKAAEGEREPGASPIDRILAGTLPPEERIAAYRENARRAWAQFDEPHDVPTPSAEEVNDAGTE